MVGGFQEENFRVGKSNSCTFGGVKLKQTLYMITTHFSVSKYHFSWLNGMEFL